MGLKVSQLIILLSLYLFKWSPGVDVIQVRVIFKLPQEFRDYPHPLAYVEYFQGRRIFSDVYGMWVVRQSFIQGRRKAAIIRVDSIRSSCHLLPQFSHPCDSTWTSENVLELCGSFYVNAYLSKYSFNDLAAPYNVSGNNSLDYTEYHTDSDTGG